MCVGHEALSCLGVHEMRACLLQGRICHTLLVKGFTPLCLTWAALVGDGHVATSLWIPPEVWANEVKRWDRTGWNEPRSD